MRVLAVVLSLFVATSALAAEIVTSFSILNDIVRFIVPGSVEVRSLVPAGGDAHVHEASSGDLKALRGAKVVIAVGAGFEPWLAKARKAAGGKAKFYELAGDLPLRGFGSRKDPHFWHDPRVVAVAIDKLREFLRREFPASADEIDRRSKLYRENVERLHVEIAAGFEGIPADQRLVITSHDAFGFFAEAYGLTMLSAQDWSTESEPTAKSVARLIRQIREKKAKGLFVENLSDPKVIQRISAETGVKIGGSLYADSLSEPSGPAADYESLMRWNARTIQRALKP